jgi:CO/xanthine dehydrogenase Mo-binding subunit
VFDPAKQTPLPGVIGSSVLRLEDLPLLTGKARFADDVHRPGGFHATVLRSPYAHARILRIDADPARNHPGVALVLTAADLPDGGPPIPMRMFSQPGMERFLQRPLALGEVRYAGEPVALVVAVSRYVAEDAAELIEVDYEPLEPALEASAGTLAGSLLIESGDIETAFREASLVVAERIVCHRHAAVPLETRGLVAELDDATGELTIWGAAKIPHVNRRILAGMLGRPEASVRMIELAVGGGFGARGEVYPEDYLIPFAAIALHRPVAWSEDRAEHLRATNHSREQVHDIAIALAHDGTFLGLRDTFSNNTGAYVRTHGMVVPGMTAGLLPGPYHWPAYRCAVSQVVTNKTPAGTYRAPGRYEANLARERVIDMAAARLGVDPVELRRRNLIRPEQIPYRTGGHTDGHPVVYEAADFPLLLERASESFDFDGLRRWRDEKPPPGRRRGVGVSFFVEKAGIGAFEYGRVEVDAEGSIAVHSGAASMGQGVETVLAQVCSEHLGVPIDRITVRHGDTATVPDGMGAFGSRASMLGGSAVMEASERLRARILELAAVALETAAGDLELVGDRVVVTGAEQRAVTLAELRDRSRPLAALGAGRSPGLSEEAWFHSADMSFPYGIHVAAVEIDLETGGVEIVRYGIAYDVGRAINPMLVEGQIQGGAAQGVGGALFEELIYDESGNLLSGSFMDYLLPTASETPEVELLLTEDAPTPLNPLGVKGAGEGGTAAAGAVLAAAVSDALGAQVRALPLTPERVRHLAREGAVT